MQLLLIFQNRAPADHHIAALSIEFDNPDLDVTIFALVQPMYRAEVNLRGRQEGPHAYVNDQASFNTVDDSPSQHRLIMISLVQIGPHSTPAGALVGNDKVTFFML